MGILQMGVEMHQHQVGVAMQQAPMLLRRKDPWMQACTTLMAIPLLMSMTMLVVVRIPLAAPLLPPPPRAQLQTLKFHKQLLLFCHGLCYIGNFSSCASFPSL
jgi:hypothetical protein